jgi:hypothetical protein
LKATLRGGFFVGCRLGARIPLGGNARGLAVWISVQGWADAV